MNAFSLSEYAIYKTKKSESFVHSWVERAIKSKTQMIIIIITYVRVALNDPKDWGDNNYKNVFFFLKNILRRPQ